MSSSSLKRFFFVNKTQVNQIIKRQISKVLNNPRVNKGLAFSMEERQLLGIHGLLPARVKTMEEQVFFCKLTVQSYKSNLSKHLYLTELSERSEKLFYRLLIDNIEEFMPIVYTPTVGQVCQKFGLLFRRARGLFINIHDKGNIENVLRNWPEKNVKVIVVTDGERILGLGDLGAHGMGIPVGKLSLYTACAGINPAHCLPITLDVGTNNKELLDDPVYVGLRQNRERGKKYEEFVDEFMEACVEVYGTNVLVQFEDFASANAFLFLNRYRNKYCMFNDDLQGTAAVVVAGLLGATKIIGKQLRDCRILFFGAGGACGGIAGLVKAMMIRQGLLDSEAIDNIYMMDVDGLVVKNRSKGVNEGPKMQYVKDLVELPNFLDVINTVKPNILIGASTKKGAFTPDILRAMANFNERPVIFALSNPTDHAECTPSEAYENTDGRCIFASGSPFKEFVYKDKLYKTGQCNNCYIFPGIGLGVKLAHMQHIPEEVFIIAAQTVAECVSEKHIERGSVFPSINEIRGVSNKMAANIMRYAFEKNIGGINVPSDIELYIRRHQYDASYVSSIPLTWQYPSQVREYDLEKFRKPEDILI
ncbi:NADP-dependent malic enzyme isoform X1 [Aethina tumida]|uniref:NADP-dependent malic enzyme isoform X1 n=2 Tax=Aethina tumida TaxID=116153 RepID=UPI00096B096E|nr:NADP-dependent malic enzyme isoform X1 [Aethina tumida]